MSRVETWTRPTEYGSENVVFEANEFGIVLVTAQVIAEMLTALGFTMTKATSDGL